MTVIRHEGETSQRKGRGRRAPRAWFENLLRRTHPLFGGDLMSPRYWLAEQFRNNDALMKYAMSTPGFLRDLQSWFRQNKDMLAPGGGFQDPLFQQFPALKNEYIQGLGKVFELDENGNPVAVRPANYYLGNLPEGHTLGFPEVPGWQPKQTQYGTTNAQEWWQDELQRLHSIRQMADQKSVPSASPEPQPQLTPEDMFQRFYERHQQVSPIYQGAPQTPPSPSAPTPRPEIPNPTPWGPMVPGPMPPFPRYGRPGGQPSSGVAPPWPFPFPRESVPSGGRRLSLLPVPWYPDFPGQEQPPGTVLIDPNASRPPWWSPKRAGGGRRGRRMNIGQLISRNPRFGRYV